MDPIGPDTEGGSMQFELMVLLCSLTAIFIVALLIIVLFFLYYEKKEETQTQSYLTLCLSAVVSNFTISNTTTNC
jgi:flagellar basal body-associated protein FliL